MANTTDIYTVTLHDSMASDNFTLQLTDYELKQMLENNHHITLIEKIYSRSLPTKIVTL